MVSGFVVVMSEGCLVLKEKETNITKILRLIDPAMVDDTPGAVNALTRKGTAFVPRHLSALRLLLVLLPEPCLILAPPVLSIVLKVSCSDIGNKDEM